MTIKLDSKRVTDDDLKSINLRFKNNGLITEEITNDFRNYIVKSFNQFNFFNIDLISLFNKVNDKSQFLQETFDDVKTLYLNQNTSINNQIKSNKQLENILDTAIKYRLATFYNAFLSEDYKIYKTLEILKSEGIKAHVLISDILDKKFGIDFILIVNNEFPLYFHSINGSSNAKERLKTKIKKHAKLDNITINRATLFNKKYHFIFTDFKGDYYHFKDLQINNHKKYKESIIKNIEKQAKCIVEIYNNATEDEKEEAKKELEQITKYLNETNIKIEIKAIIN
ncbi:hypothetical protein EY650_10305 [Enterococcus faecalis]|uniref:hypothetical protein n=1 Tax=Enterococcus faecalis TaxID=1351 RepID=UPI000330A515|nr:hypothetical protein [Enterococcus faecalis]CWJ83233.1 Uncharacterised protein [Streptococcus pneumoniae]EOJ43172.1 hypothetical protein UOC_00930 [Enterococcus faecalis EnGen0289]EOL16883.1 hypothetical protein WU1_01085 [Enterococcus faecalis EnGen0327]ETT98622.1 hypothetical protein P002_00065 [Enterococcus faecalis EnGen0402]ETU49662.1 hypothetical protein P021_00790 [Enterococcus faecalis EnGen0421]